MLAVPRRPFSHTSRKNSVRVIAASEPANEKAFNLEGELASR